MTESGARGEQEPQLVEKKGTTSQVWTFFGFEKEETDSDKVICRVCKKYVLGRGGNTSNVSEEQSPKRAQCYYNSKKS